MARTKRKRRGSSVAVSKMESGEGAGLIELFNGRCQLVISNFYYEGINERTRGTAQRFFDDYKKLIPKKEMLEHLTGSLDLMAEDEKELRVELMKSIEEELVGWIKTHFKASTSDLNQLKLWRKTWQQTSTQCSKK